MERDLSVEPNDNLILKDLTLNCIDCGDTFVFEAGERLFYQNKGFPEPKRCPKCREWRKRTTPNGGARPC